MKTKQFNVLWKQNFFSVVALMLLASLFFFISCSSRQTYLQVGYERVWSVQSRGNLSSVNHIYKDILIATSGAYMEIGNPIQYIYGIEKLSGKIKWMMPFSGEDPMEIQFRDSYMLYVRSDKIFKAIDVLTGKNISVTVQMQSLIQKNGSNRKPAGYRMENRHLRYEQNGITVWKIEEPFAFQDLFSLPQKICYSLDQVREIRCRSHVDGTILDQFRVRKIDRVKEPDRINYSFLAEEDSFYIGNYDGKVEAWKRNMQHR